MRKLVVTAAVTVMALTAASCSSSPSTSAKSPPPAPKASVGSLSGKTPAQILTAALAAATKSGSTHYVLTAVEGSSSQTISGDATTTEGHQTVVQGTQQIEVIYVGGTAYVKGNATGLTADMGLSTTQAATYANKWIAVKSTDSLFKSIVQAVTLAGTLSDLNPSGTLTLTAPTTVAGRQAIGVKGGLPGKPQTGVTGSTTLYVAASDPTVPLMFSGKASSGTQHAVDKGTFTNWGKAVQLTAPTGAVPLSTVTK